MRKSKMWISAFILLVIGLHAVPLLFYQGHRQTTWPFLAWGMYAKAYPAGPIETMDRFLKGTTAAGTEEEITPRMIGLTKPTFRNHYMNPIYRGDTTVALELLDRVNRDRTDPFVELRTVGIKYILADTAVVQESLPVQSYRANTGAR